MSVKQNLKINLTLSGQVTSPRGNIQGAKVVISKANVIEHNVRVNGKIEDSRIHTTHGNPFKLFFG